VQILLECVGSLQHNVAGPVLVCCTIVKKELFFLLNMMLKYLLDQNVEQFYLKKHTKHEHKCAD